MIACQLSFPLIRIIPRKILRFVLKLNNVLDSTRRNSASVAEWSWRVTIQRAS
jgi:hypothetical protein